MVHERNYLLKYKEIILLEASERKFLKKRDDFRTELRHGSHAIAVHIFLVIVSTPVYEDIPAFEEVFDFIKHGPALRTLCEDKLWEDLLTKARRWIIDNGYGKTSFSISESHDPVSKF